MGDKSLVELFQNEGIDFVKKEAMVDSVVESGSRVVYDSRGALVEPTMTEDVAKVVSWFDGPGQSWVKEIARAVKPFLLWPFISRRKVRIRSTMAEESRDGCWMSDLGNRKFLLHFSGQSFFVELGENAEFG
jgi:hypothetical protein